MIRVSKKNKDRLDKLAQDMYEIGQDLNTLSGNIAKPEDSWLCIEMSHELKAKAVGLQRIINRLEVIKE